jgi:hypothetical protein
MQTKPSKEEPRYNERHTRRKGFANIKSEILLCAHKSLGALSKTNNKGDPCSFKSMKITSLVSTFCLLAMTSLNMLSRATAQQAGSFVAPIPEPSRVYDMPTEEEEHEGT